MILAVVNAIYAIVFEAIIPTIDYWVAIESQRSNIYRFLKKSLK